MAFPFVFAANFEQGDFSEWDSESDTGSLSDYPHYSTLAKVPGIGMPYRGAYCMRIQPGDTNDHTVTEGDLNIADDGTAWVRFAIWHKLEATADDIFNIYEFQQAAGTVEAVISMKVTAATNLVEITVADGTEASSGFVYLSPGEWHWVEVKMRCDTADEGTLELFLDGYSVVSLSSLDNGAAIGAGVLGTQNTLATTTGTILLDEFAFDSLQIGAIIDRWDEAVMIHKSAHVFVGPGIVDNVTMLSGAGTDCILRIYDTDTAYTTDQSNIRLELTNTANAETVDPAGVPVHVHRGCYIEVSGTDPKFLVKLRAATGWGSEAAIRSWARTRKPGKYGS